MSEEEEEKKRLQLEQEETIRSLLEDDKSYRTIFEMLLEKDMSSKEIRADVKAKDLDCSTVLSWLEKRGAIIFKDDSAKWSATATGKKVYGKFF